AARTARSPVAPGASGSAIPGADGRSEERHMRLPEIDAEGAADVCSAAPSRCGRPACSSTAAPAAGGSTATLERRSAAAAAAAAGPPATDPAAPLLAGTPGGAPGGAVETRSSGRGRHRDVVEGDAGAHEADAINATVDVGGGRCRQRHELQYDEMDVGPEDLL